MRRPQPIDRKSLLDPLARAAFCSLAIGVAAAASAAAAGFGGARATHPQTDKVGSNRVASVNVSCPSGTSGKCSGKLTLKTAQKVNGTVLTLGSNTLSIGSGKSSGVHVTISQQGWNLVKAHSLAVNAVVSSHDGAGHHATKTTAINLKKKPSGTCFYCAP